MVPVCRVRAGKSSLKMRFVLNPEGIGEDLSRQKNVCKGLKMATSIVSMF